jgi:NAD(P)-dependent dehydrogenase (short-subunit alcohol dehydrogenase family)
MQGNGLFSLDGKVAVVIGGGGVLAGAMAAGLAEAGADISILDVNAAAAEARAASIRTLGRKAVGVQCDATSKQSLQQALDATLAQLGRVDILLNAAGVNSGTPFFEITEDEWHRILNIDLTACRPRGIDAAPGRLTCLGLDRPEVPFSAGLAIRRNDVIAALGDGLILIASGLKGGSAYSVRWALRREPKRPEPKPSELSLPEPEAEQVPEEGQNDGA